MALKKSQLYSSLWKSCDELRGGMDASQYKDYVLVLLFVKYVSDKFADNPLAPIEVPQGCRFAELIALKGKSDIGEKINVLLTELAEASGIASTSLPDFDDDSKLGQGKEKVERLSNLVGLFQGLDFSRNRADGDDLLGDAYEFLMRHFATESGKSKGQFYTPAEVSRIMAQVVGVAGAKDQGQTLFDPACGSGSLLIKAHDEALAATGLDLAIYGQEMDNATSALAKMNMILHSCESAEIFNGNTLANPHWTLPDGTLKRHDFVVANPPFSTKSWASGINFSLEAATFNRFAPGVPPSKNGDYAFLLHILASLKPNGRGAVILPHGVLFRGHAEAQIREQLLRRGVIEAIIGLPPNLFYGTGIPACIIVLDKSRAQGRDGVFLMDASRGFLKDGNKNRLRAQDIHKIVDTFARRLEVPGYARQVPFAEIASPANDFNLNLPRYIDGSEAPDQHDIAAHLQGGIPLFDIEALGRFWDEFPTLRARLFAPGEREGYARLGLPDRELVSAIETHPEVQAWRDELLKRFDAWWNAHQPALLALSSADKPKVWRATLSETLLEAFSGAAIADAYDVYQGFMDFWDAQMGDDVDAVISDGWLKAAQPVLLVDAKEKPDLIIERRKFKTDLLPPVLLIARYFRAQSQALHELEAQSAALSGELDELREEHGGEDGVLGAHKDDAGKINEREVKLRLLLAHGEDDGEPEIAILERYLKLSGDEANAKKQLLAKSRELDDLVFVRYGKLTESEIQTLLLSDKWRAELQARVQSEIERATGQLSSRVKSLAARYAVPMPQLAAHAQTLAARAHATWETLGFQA